MLNISSKLFLGQNLGDQNGEDTKSIVDFDQDITQILKLKQLNMKLKDSMDMTANLNSTDYVDLEKVLKQILDYLDENKALEQDSVLDKIKKAEDFYETCTDMLEKAEEDLKEVLKQSHNAAAIAYHKKVRRGFTSRVHFFVKVNNFYKYQF